MAGVAEIMERKRMESTISLGQSKGMGGSWFVESDEVHGQKIDGIRHRLGECFTPLEAGRAHLG